MANGNGTVNLDLIGKRIESLTAAVKAANEENITFRTEVIKRLAAIEKAQDRFRVRIALLETRDRDLAGDLAAIARIIEAAGLLKEKH